jgi:hypothetical protein
MARADQQVRSEELCGNRNSELQRGLKPKGRRRALGGVPQCVTTVSNTSPLDRQE